MCGILWFFPQGVEWHQIGCKGIQRFLLCSAIEVQLGVQFELWTIWQGSMVPWQKGLVGRCEAQHGCTPSVLQRQSFWNCCWPRCIWSSISWRLLQVVDKFYKHGVFQDQGTIIKAYEVVQFLWGICPQQKRHAWTQIGSWLSLQHYHWRWGWGTAQHNLANG